MKRSYASRLKVFTPGTRPRLVARRSSARRIMTCVEINQCVRCKEQADVATLRGRLEGLSKRLAAANADAKRKKDAYEAAAATASKLEQEKKELHEHLAMMVLSSEQRKEDKLKELLAAMGATDVS